MEVDGCGSFTHLQSNWSDLVTILIVRVYDIEGKEVSLTPNRSGITSYAFGGINEQDFLTVSEDWIYNSQRRECYW